jgi:hypothetical protein
MLGDTLGVSGAPQEEEEEEEEEEVPLSLPNPIVHSTNTLECALIFFERYGK